MNRGEIWTLNLDPTVAAEIRKTRPVIIVSNDEIGVPSLKSGCPGYGLERSLHVRYLDDQIDPTQETGLRKTSAADAFQVRSVSEERFVKRLGRVSENDLESITEALISVLGY